MRHFLLVRFKHIIKGQSIRAEALGNFEGKSRLLRQYRGILNRYRGKIESTEAESRHSNKITKEEILAYHATHCYQAPNTLRSYSFIFLILRIRAIPNLPLCHYEIIAKI